MTGSRHVQDVGIRAVAIGCPKIEVLRLSGCDGVTGQGLRALAKHCRCLKELALTGAKYLSDAELELLRGQKLRASLTAVDLAGCVKLTDKGVAHVCHNIGERLFVLNISESLATDHSSKVRQCELKTNKYIYIYIYEY